MKTCTRAVLTAVPLCALAAAAPGGIELGENLLNNHDAEAGPGGSGFVVPVPGWSVTEGLFTVASYGATGDLLQPGDPGPPDRDNQYFTGGEAETSVAEQRYNLFPFATRIDNSEFSFELSGWLGAAGSEGDSAAISVTFLDSMLDEIDTFSIGTDTRGIASAQGLSFFLTDDFIPVGAREAVVELTFLRTPGTGAYNDGAADNLSFVIIPAPGSAALFGLAGAVAARRRR